MSKKNKSKNYGKYILIVVGILILDQLTKFLVQKTISLNESVVLIKDFVSFVFIKNTGAGFSILQNQNTLLLFISAAVFGLLIYYFNSFKVQEKIAVSFILGGIAGNVLDRLLYGSVIDFISFSFWPAFNIADMAISLSIVYLVLKEFRK